MKQTSNGKEKELPFADIAEILPRLEDRRGFEARQRERVSNTRKAGEIKGRTTERIVEQINKTHISIPLEDVLEQCPEVKELMKKNISRNEKARVPKATIEEVEDDEMKQLAFLEDHTVEWDDLPVTQVTVLQQATDTMAKGSIIVSDPVLQYLESLDPETARKKIFVARESHSLRAVYPIVNRNRPVETLLDSGSQIVSMDVRIAKLLGIVWRSDIQIQMQSANKQVESSLGLARNVPFKLGELEIYLQVHVMQAPAYDILMGRPFDALTASQINNSTNGDQIITLTDPNTGARYTLPTYVRGHKPPEMKEENFLITSRNC